MQERFEAASDGDPEFLEPLRTEILESAKSNPPKTRSEFWKWFERFSDRADELELGEWTGLAIEVCHGDDPDVSEVWDIVNSPPYPEVRVAATYEGRALPEDFIKIGGAPKSIQGERAPICPRCDNDMAFLAQIGSLPTPLRQEVPDLEPFIFSDMGNVYLYACQNCSTIEASMDCF